MTAPRKPDSTSHSNRVYRFLIKPDPYNGSGFLIFRKFIGFQAAIRVILLYQADLGLHHNFPSWYMLFRLILPHEDLYSVPLCFLLPYPPFTGFRSAPPLNGMGTGRLDL